MDQCSMIQELTKTCAKHQSSHGRPISCQLNRLKEVRKQMNCLNCLEIEMHRIKSIGMKKNQLNPAKENMNQTKHET